MEDDEKPSGENDGGAPDLGEGGAGQKPPAGDNQTQALLRQKRKLEKDLADLRKAEEERKTAELSEVERLKKEKADLEAERQSLQGQIKTQAIQSRFEAAAAKLGAVDTEAAFKLADLSGVEMDADGKVTGVEEALKSLKQARPFLFGEPSAPKSVGGNGGGNPGGQNAPKAYTSEDLKKMSPDEFKQAREAIKAGKAKLAG